VFGRRSALKGRKVAPKYRGPGGETWAGRGARPRWLTALIKQGRKLEEFAIDKALAARKGRRAKKARRKKKQAGSRPVAEAELGRVSAKKMRYCAVSMSIYSS